MILQSSEETQQSLSVILSRPICDGNSEYSPYLFKYSIEYYHGFIHGSPEFPTKTSKQTTGEDINMFTLYQRINTSVPCHKTVASIYFYSQIITPPWCVLHPTKVKTKRHPHKFPLSNPPSSTLKTHAFMSHNYVNFDQQYEVVNNCNGNSCFFFSFSGTREQRNIGRKKNHQGLPPLPFLPVEGGL